MTDVHKRDHQENENVNVICDGFAKLRAYFEKKLALTSGKLSCVESISCTLCLSVYVPCHWIACEQVLNSTVDQNYAGPAVPDLTL